MSPDPGSTSGPSSGKTLLVAFSENLAVSVVGVSLVVIDVPMPPSVAPRTSAMASAGMWSIRPCFTSAENIAPDEIIRRRRREVPAVGLVVEGAQQRLGEGVADDDEVLHALALDGVPQLDRVEAHDPARSTAVPPNRWGTIIPSQQPVPCISGGPDIATNGVPASIHLPRRGRAARRRRSIGARPIIGGYERRKNAVNSPQRVHDALRHPGGATGVEDVDVVAVGVDPRRPARPSAWMSS